MTTVYTPESVGTVIDSDKETVTVYQEKTNTVRTWLREEVEEVEIEKTSD
jgi:hypothetical protein